MACLFYTSSLCILSEENRSQNCINIFQEIDPIFVNSI